MKIYDRIKQLRRIKDLSQKEVAEKVHKSISAYNRLENGETKISVDELPIIAKALDCTIDDLFQEEIMIRPESTESETTAMDNHSNNFPEALFYQYERILQKVLTFQEKSEERIRNFMREIIAEVNDKNNIDSSDSV